jgi:hypothetical protein
MSFICIGKESIGKRGCTYMIAMYWSLVYIIVALMAGALYLSDYTSTSYQKIGTRNFEYIIKLFSIIVVLFIMSILLICIRIYKEIVTQN